MTKQLKPQLAIDTNFANMTYPKMAFRKVDGVRGGQYTPGQFTGRSLKPLGNKFTTAKFSMPEYEGLEGEMTLDGRLTGEELCNLTNSAVSRHEGYPHIVLNLFDYLHPDVINLTYLERYTALVNHLLDSVNPNIYLLPYILVSNPEEAEAFYNESLELGYEGAIYREPKAMHKSGRATAKLQDFWRAKPASDKDAIVLSVEEGQRNENPEFKNELGETTRSTLASGMVPNGMIGTLICRDVLTGQIIRVSPGKMTHLERAAWFEDQTQIVGHGIKYRSLDTGVVEAPRHARFIVRRALADIITE